MPNDCEGKNKLAPTNQSQAEPSGTTHGFRVIQIPEVKVFGLEIVYCWEKIPSR